MKRTSRASKRSNSEEVKAIIFDFDGVITESVNIKTEAFKELFREYPAHRDAIVKLHLMHGGLSRFKKFEMIYGGILKKKLTARDSKKLGEKFSAICMRRVVGCPFVKGAMSFLKKFHGTLDMFIVSGTPQKEMRMIAKKRGISRYFKDILGSPRGKAELVGCLLRKHKYPDRSVILVGDSKEDMEGASANNIRFILRKTKGGSIIKKRRGVEHTIADIDGLRKYVLKGVKE